MQEFHNLKAALKSMVKQSFPSTDVILELTTDASEVAAGAVLRQRIGDIREPLAFFLSKIHSTGNNQMRIAAYDRELLAIYLSLKHFDWKVNHSR